MSERIKQDAEIAIQELRLFISLFADADPTPGSRTAKQLEAARRAVAAYDEVERAPAENAA